jgi:positive regulator of sigma E activity
LKFKRIVFFYALFFVIALIIAAMFFRPANESFIVLFSFIAPGIMVWWYEKRRARRLEAKTNVQHHAL